MMQLKETKIWSSLKKSAPIRAIRPAYIVGQNLVDPYLVSTYKKQHQWDKPIPPLYLRRLTCGPSIPGYVESGERIFTTLMKGLDVVDKDITNFQNVLDFGCGVGRVLQYFSDYDHLKLTGCDPNGNLIKWLSDNYHIVDFYQTNFHPPLPFETDSFDLIYSVSVFTHLSEKLQFNWLTELQRVLRKDGIALITTLGEHGARRDDGIGLTKNLTEQLQKTQFIFKRTSGTKLQTKLVNPNASSEDEIYGLTYHSKKYIHQHWQDFFEILEIQDGIIDNLQDLVVLINSKI